MSDLIKREDAIKLIDKATTEPQYQHENEDWVCGLVQAKDIIQELPTAELTDNWIPVSERLPSESGGYLCTIPLDADETYTEVLTFHKGRFYEDDDEWGATCHDDVLAWMPLPKPYKGGARMKGGDDE